VTRAVAKLPPPPPSPPTSASCIILQKYKWGQLPRPAAQPRRPHAACIPDSYTPVVAAHTTHVPCRIVELLSLLDKASGQVVAKVQCDVSLSLRVCRGWLRGVPRVLLCGADERCSSLPV
jgi:hypothetical protein